MTSTSDPTIHESSSKESISKDIESNAEAKPKRVVTGRDILKQYFQGDPVALITYRKICNAFEVLPKWEPAAKVQFLEQFLNVSDLLDSRCAGLVTNLARLSWQAIPESVMNRYLSMLCDVAIRQVFHTEVIYCGVVNNLIPVVKFDEGNKTAELALPEEEQDKYYAMAHRVISQILKCFPMSNQILLKALRVGVPHHSNDSWRFIGYMRNLVRSLEYVGKIRADVWDLIIDQMVMCDNMLAKSDYRYDKNCTADTAIFDMDEDREQEDGKEESEMTTKLDGVMRDVLCYIAMKHNADCSALGDTKWLHLGNEAKKEEVFSILLSLLENRMLLSVHVRYTSFIWLYTCSLDEKYATQTLDFLWSIIVRPQTNQSDIAKGHGAAAYLAAFLARAKYLDIRVATTWMSRIASWCIQYLDNCGITNKQIMPGVIRHGVFYALCQAFFIIFSFRYKEMVKSGDIEEVGRWGLGRIVHSPLDPLKFVVRPVGLCFGAITRSLQLVYCNHLLPFDAGTKLPFEPMFPFDSFKLKSSSVLICSHTRRFSPLAEDKSEVSSVLRSSQISSSLNEDNMDYLEEDNMIIGSYSDNHPSGFSQCGNQSSMFTIYSSSPGLRHLDSPIDMNSY
uniref:RNA polymerase I-specific transcription initiation factor RRN3 n=1 Tax=Haemonchus contortus TaxID=6289 RepID=A0A7I4Y9W9_HAECO